MLHSKGKMVFLLLAVIGLAGCATTSDLDALRAEVQQAIDDAVLTEHKGVLEDLLAAAVNDAVRKIEARNKEAMSGLASGLNLPPGFKLPF